MDLIILIILFSPPKSARKITQILAVVAVSFGAYIHGTTVVFPAVAIPSLKKSNASGTNYIESLRGDSNESETYNFEDAFLPFSITDDDISLIGKQCFNI